MGLGTSAHESLRHSKESPHQLVCLPAIVDWSDLEGSKRPENDGDDMQALSDVAGALRDSYTAMAGRLAMFELARSALGPGLTLKPARNGPRLSGIYDF